MSDEVINHAINGYTYPISAVLRPHQSVTTILLCKNSLIEMGIKHLLDGTCFAIAGTASNVAALSDSFSAATPDLFIVHGSDPVQQMVETVRHLKGKYPDVRIVVIASSYDLNCVRLGRSAGVDGFCLSGSHRDVLIESLELVMLGEVVLPTALMASLLNETETHSVPTAQDDRTEAGSGSYDPGARKLSAREAEILGWLMEGAPNKVIARKLDVAEATIKVHIKAILRKIGAANRTQAAMWASTHLPTSDGPSLAA